MKEHCLSFQLETAFLSCSETINNQMRPEMRLTNHALLSENKCIMQLRSCSSEHTVRCYQIHIKCMGLRMNLSTVTWRVFYHWGVRTAAASLSVRHQRNWIQLYGIPDFSPSYHFTNCTNANTVPGIIPRQCKTGTKLYWIFSLLKAHTVANQHSFPFSTVDYLSWSSVVKIEHKRDSRTNIKNKW